MELPTKAPFAAKLRKLKGWATSKNVRLISDADFFGILIANQRPENFHPTQPPTPEMHLLKRMNSLRLLEHIEARRARESHKRAKREHTFSLAGLKAYDNKSAISRKPQSSSDGRSIDLQACHLWAVEDCGPDLIENAIALSSHWHWRLDHHLFTLKDDGRIILSTRIDAEDRDVLQERTITFPSNPNHRPAVQYLALRRRTFFARQAY